MKRTTTLLILAAIAITASAWNSRGHQVVAYIGKSHLSYTAYQAVNEILDGTSMVYYASWMDQVVNDPEYSYTSTWHYLNVDEGQAYEERASLAYTDAIAALYEQSEVLRNPYASKEEKAFAIKVLTHVVGDMHQPMHAGHESDKGGNYITIYYNGERTNLHHLWDYNMVYDAHNWSYYDWAQNIDILSDEENAAIAAGTIDDWGRENVSIASDVYRAFPKYYHADQDDINQWEPVTRLQLLKGGLRLATLLNSTLDPQYNSIQTPILPEVKTYYNLQGLPVSHPLKGEIYIVKRGHAISKEIYR